MNFNHSWMGSINGLSLKIRICAYPIHPVENTLFHLRNEEILQYSRNHFDCRVVDDYYLKIAIQGKPLYERSNNGPTNE